MAILVLGGAGYIGSHTVRALIEAKRDVIIIDNLETGFAQSIPKEVTFYQADIRNKKELDKIFDQETIDGVIHFAAYSQVGESMQNPLKYYDNNVNGTAILLESMLEHEIKHIVFSSTAATYGEPTRIPILESDPAIPANCYGDTKLTMEKMMGWCEKAYGLRHVALRYFNAAGAHPTGIIGEAHEPESHLIPLILQVPNGQRDFISIFGDDYPTPDGTCIRDYIHVMDLASAHILALDYLLAGGKSDVFNLGNGVGFSVREVIDICREVTDFDIPEKIEARRAGDPAQLVASSEKAQKILGWKSKYADLNTIISTAWQWHQKNPNGFNKQ
ncbi:MAG: UDP-glucose 4-epimerase GalE [Clostridiaceae bacterium]|nr:UDP-glucose 4-epimerase GalE [Clostridiaceae bacterium]